MNRSGKYLLIIIALCILALVGLKYKQFFLDKNYSFITRVACDPANETCFQCDKSSAPCDGSTGILFTDGSPYKYIEITPAKDAPDCLGSTDNIQPTCLNFTCQKDDKHCATTYCSEDVLDDGEICMPAPVTH